jgi:hypothetical protein
MRPVLAGDICVPSLGLQRFGDALTNSGQDFENHHGGHQLEVPRVGRCKHFPGELPQLGATQAAQGDFRVLENRA